MSVRWKNAILDLKPYQPGKSIEEVKKMFGLEKITKLASNENPFGCSPEVLKALHEKKNNFALYPDGYATILREAVAKHHGLSEKQFIFGNGSDEVIQLISRSILEPGKNTIMPTPSFPQYKHNAILEGAEIREVELVDGEHDLDSMLRQIDENTAVIWLCSPNNPTGTYIKETKLNAFLEKVPQDILVVLDEAYYEYVEADDYPESIKLLEKYKNIMILRTFSKIYGLASFRIGYGISSDEIVSRLEPAREPFNVNSLALLVAAKAIQDQEFIQKCKTENRKGLQAYYSFCEAEGLSYYPSQGNFILIDFGVDGDEVFQYLMRKGYIVRSGKALGFPTAVRVTVGTEEQNEGLMKAMKEFLHETVTT